MGPQSDNRGYVEVVEVRQHQTRELQWVHSPITVVMSIRVLTSLPKTLSFNGSTVR